MTPETLVIVVGASGRLGTRLLPLLVEPAGTVIAITRQSPPRHRPAKVRWFQTDITDTDERHHSLDALTDVAARHQHVILVDLVLRRTTVTAMRTSIAAATAYLTRLHRRVVAAGQSCSLIAANTTAALAPRLYQTPYGLAKRHQLHRYSISEISGTAFLLPSLIETPHDQAPAHRRAWTYSSAARLMSRAIRNSPCEHGRHLRLVAPHTPPHDTTTENTAGITDLPRALTSHARLILHRRNSPQAHRDASHLRLALTPRRLRRQRDHHLVPPVLVNRISRALGVSVERAHEPALTAEELET